MCVIVPGFFDIALYVSKHQIRERLYVRSPQLPFRPLNVAIEAPTPPCV